MKKLSWIVLAAFFCLSQVIATAQQSSGIQYPVTRKTDQVDDYHGTKIADPYRWLENDTTAETRAWVKAENKVTFGWLDKIPFRNAFKERILRTE